MYKLTSVSTVPKRLVDTIISGTVPFGVQIEPFFRFCKFKKARKFEAPRKLKNKIKIIKLLAVVEESLFGKKMSPTGKSGRTGRPEKYRHKY